MEHNEVPELLHYLDDFLIFGVPDSLKCWQALEKALQLCLKLGVPVAKSKTEGPATSSRGLVSVEMAWIMVRGARNRKEATFNNNECGVVEQKVVRQHHQIPGVITWQWEPY